MTTELGWVGYAPTVKVEPGNPWAAKYAKLYDNPEYRKGAPGELYCQVFLNKAKPAPGSRIIDCGAGTGRGAVMLALLGGLKVTMIDFVKNSLDERVKDVMAAFQDQTREELCPCRVFAKSTALPIEASATCQICHGTGKVKTADRPGGLEFIKADLEKPLPVITPYAFCGDVMEHIPPDKVDLVLNNILRAAQKCWFTIAMFEEVHGMDILGEPLHISLHPFEWWEQKFKERDCEFIYTHNQDDHYAHFYVNAWRTGQEIVEKGILNTDEQQIMENVRFNTRSVWTLVTGDEELKKKSSIIKDKWQIKTAAGSFLKTQPFGGTESPSELSFSTKEEAAKFIRDLPPGNDGFSAILTEHGNEFETEDVAWGHVVEGWTPLLRPKWQQVRPHIPLDHELDLECMILGGGWSLNQYVDEIKENRANGVRLITLNGSYLWAIAHGLTPSAQVIVDARAFNARFTKPVLDNCRYLIASQCDPSVFEGLPKDRTFIWHTMADQIMDILNQRYGENAWYGIPGGSTVLLRAIPLFRMLGYSKFILYGCDSCLTEDKHHAYDQPENDKAYVMPVAVNPGGRIFMCNASMTSQAQEFIDTIKYIGDDIELDVKGDGLLAYILKIGADMADLQQLE